MLERQINAERISIEAFIGGDGDVFDDGSEISAANNGAQSTIWDGTRWQTLPTAVVLR